MCSILSLHSSNLERQRNLSIELLSLGVTAPPVTPVTELVLGPFFFTKLCPSLSPLYTYFIVTVIYYYQIYFVEFDP